MDKESSDIEEDFGSRSIGVTDDDRDDAQLGRREGIPRGRHTEGASEAATWHWKRWEKAKKGKQPDRQISKKKSSTHRERKEHHVKRF